MMKNLSETAIQLWFQLSRSYHVQLKYYDQFLKEWNFTISQFELIVKVGENEHISQKELAEKMFFTKGNITQLIIKMEKEGYISREQNWKTKYIKLTDKGEAIFEQVLPKQRQFFLQQFKGLSIKEQKQLIRLLTKLNKS
ncbi:MarR family winged helix-turn-helix transcriptional regulator [Sporolactobacillus kofuensis]|uniref:MarR family winged helix-turn-helix transcriptional regulator n=1 Tax=Sporolactobacillus kofuensis TaxID=269672 RepID=A0ABW1WI76_9BACL|nr:MarR family transcriptional regulator [Sporolactobacillus kofuensis]MCO7176201.1 MarR family transcriptional regulator [Sporolactobacillus kofuensis]